LCAVFGRKKRRQEPISAVAPEPLDQGAWLRPDGIDGETVGAEALVDVGGYPADVSRGTSGADGAAIDDRVPEVPATSAREAGAGAQSANGAIAALDAATGRDWDPASEARAETRFSDPAALVRLPSTDELDGGPSSAWRADPVVSGVAVLDDGVRSAGSDGDVTLDGSASAAATYARLSRSAAPGVSVNDPEAAAVDGTSLTPPTSLGVLFPDGADAAHGAFSSAPRRPTGRPAVPTSAAAVSRETTSTAEAQTIVGGADLGAGAGAGSVGSGSAPPERTGENEEVPSQPEQVYGAVHDDEARRAALVDSLPDADEDTPLMAQIQADARRRIQLRGRRFPRPPQTRIITVANQKGGVGKTTTTVNLAAALAQSGLNVLVLDNDPQGNASTALGVAHHAGTPSIYEVLVDEAPMAGAVQECPDVPNLWCVPATIDLSGAEIELVSMVARETRLRTALDAYLTGRIAAGQEPIDYVFVDCPPSLGLLTVNAFVVGREVLIPIQCEYYALEGLTQLLKTIQLIQAHLNPELHVSTILLTMYDSRTNLAQQVAQEVRDHFPETTLRTSVPRSVRISEAPSYGQTVITYDAGSTGALAYLEAARELAERGAADGHGTADAVGSSVGSPTAAGDGDGLNHTSDNGTPGGTSSVVGSSAGTHLEEQ
jgi:chromosome partitioning protein